MKMRLKKFYLLKETTSPVYAKISESGEYISKKTTKDTYSLRKTTEISITPNSTHPASLHCRSSDECGADAYCERRSGVCRCYPGFDGEPPTIPCVGNVYFFLMFILQYMEEKA